MEHHFPENTVTTATLVRFHKIILEQDHFYSSIIFLSFSTKTDFSKLMMKHKSCIRA